MDTNSDFRAGSEPGSMATTLRAAYCRGSRRHRRAPDTGAPVAPTLGLGPKRPCRARGVMRKRGAAVFGATVVSVVSDPARNWGIRSGARRSYPATPTARAPFRPGCARRAANAPNMDRMLWIESGTEKITTRAAAPAEATHASGWALLPP